MRKLLVILFTIPPLVQAQTPQQMEYERQQREYRQQMERQREQQRQQQKIQDDNARRQQEETRRANTPPPASPSYSQPDPPRSYQGAGSVGRESGVLQPRSNLKGGPAPAPATTGPATLSLTASAIAGTSLLVLRKSIDTVLSEAGIAGKSSFKTWAQACETGTPVCSVGQKALLAATVAAAKTDHGGNGRTAAIPAGTYYVFGRASANGMWNVKVELKPGDNKVNLDARNVTLLE
jgi:hypothetical protein